MASSPMNSPPANRRRLSTWEVTAISVGFMGPVMAMSLNGIGVAGLVGKAVPSHSLLLLLEHFSWLTHLYDFSRELRTPVRYMR